jgi:Holliday junction DNA helicase RuvA
MIGRIRGVLIEKRPPWIVVDCHGVGYELEAPMTTIWSLPELQQEVSLHTHLVVRDDAHLLFGFASEEERRLFRDLLKVSGVGAKVALAILSGLETRAFVECIQIGDVARLTSVPGIGKKTAERLIVEMRDRVADWGISLPAAKVDGSSRGIAGPISDAVAGLVALGYKPQEASKLVGAMGNVEMSSEDIIRQVLRSMVKN